MPAPFTQPGEKKLIPLQPELPHTTSAEKAGWETPKREKRTAGAFRLEGHSVPTGEPLFQLQTTVAFDISMGTEAESERGERCAGGGRQHKGI